LSGTISVTGAPAGFTPAYEGVSACPSADSTAHSCNELSPTYVLANSGTYTLSLAPGSWEITGFYEVNPVGGAFLGTSRLVTITSGVTTTLNVTVPYAAPATIKGTVGVTGVPAGVAVQELSVLLCPSFDPYNGSPSLACVTGNAQTGTNPTSGTYDVSGLPPVAWTVYASYCTEYGCETGAKTGVSVTLVAGGTSTVNVTTPYIIPSQGLLTPTVDVTGAPAGLSDTLGVTACPKGAASTSCQTYYESPDFPENLLLAAGVWEVTGYYLASPFDNAVPGPTEAVTITGGHDTDITLSVPYQVPGTAAGSIIVAGIPSGVSVTSYTLVACPASSPLTTSGPSPECASEYSGPAGYGFGAADRNEEAPDALSRPPAGVTAAASAPYNVYKITSLTPGKWLLYPGYQTLFGSYSDPTGTLVTVVGGRTVTRNLLVPYQKPADGAVVGQVVVIDAPTNGFEAGAQACTAPPTPTTPCAGEQQAPSEGGGAYQLVLTPGKWWISGFLYEFGGVNESEITSPPREVIVTAGTSTTENFSVVGS
jgi:hypothetical protein